LNQKSIYEKWLNSVDNAELKDQLDTMTKLEIDDAFSKDLEFGTGGLRGVIGAGTNRMNFYTVNRATQGICNFLKSEKQTFSIAIAFDSRIKSKEFARSAASVIAANGANAYIFSELMPTPVLSFAVRELKCDAGIVITASHNPAKYNGYKVYGNDGCQITLEVAELVQKYIKKINIFEDVKNEPFEKGAQDGKIHIITNELLEKFLNMVETCSINPEVLKHSDLSVIYTPLNGAGNKPVRAILSKMGLKNIAVVPEQENPDGHFPTCQKPNPEERSAFHEALRLAKKISPDLLIATDPDCDRVGIAVKKDNEYVLLTGNETGCLLLEYILSQKRARELLPQKPVIVKTIVTTAMAYEIAKAYGVSVIDTLTGFKFIGEQIGVLEKGHKERDYIFGFEESYGYLPGVFVRDKDAVSASMLICEMAAFYKENNTTLLEELEKLYRRYGYWKHKLITFAFEGIDGMEKMKSIMDEFRKGDMSFAEFNMLKIDDYERSVSIEKVTKKQSELTLPKSDVLVFSLEKNCEIVVRPSGTEPKLKCYLTVMSESNESSTKMLKAIETDLTNKINVL
jgi:phosphoglucomutase